MPLRVKKKACTGCKLCQLACSGWHEGVFNPEKARIRVTHEYGDREVKIGIAFCNQCEKCIETCPTAAISHNGSWIVVNREICIGCKTCAETCPLNAVHYNHDNKSVICDLCEGTPQCIDWCPKDIIIFKEKQSQTRRTTNE